jgi:hypothetical protein
MHLLCLSAGTLMRCCAVWKALNQLLEEDMLHSEFLDEVPYKVRNMLAVAVVVAVVALLLLMMLVLAVLMLPSSSEAMRECAGIGQSSASAA